MKQFIAWVDSTSDRAFNSIKWSLSALSGTATSAVLWALLSEV